MKLSRHVRFVTAMVALIGVLFTQMVIMAYVCPNTQLANTLEISVRSAMANAHSDMPDCDQTDGKPSAPCETAVIKQTLDKPEVPQISPFFPLNLVAAIVQRDAPDGNGFVAIPIVLTRTASPSLSIQNCCFQV